jgi:hypothetical protein
VKGKLAPRYVGPYRISKRIGKLAYRLELPEKLAGVHPMFHVSQLRKCLKLLEEQVHIEALDIQDTLEYHQYTVQILDRVTKDTRSTTIPMCKVLWSNHTERERGNLGEGVRIVDPLPLLVRKVCHTLNLRTRFQ